MSHFECKRVENCFASSAVYQYRLGYKIDDEFLAWLANISSAFKCRRDFPRPYFNATLADGTQVKGVIGDIAMKVVYPDDNSDQCKEAFEKLLSAAVRA